MGKHPLYMADNELKPNLWYSLPFHSIVMRKQGFDIHKKTAFKGLQRNRPLGYFHPFEHKAEKQGGWLLEGMVQFTRWHIGKLRHMDDLILGLSL